MTLNGLELVQIRAAHNGRIALDGLCVKVAAGTIHAIIGERRSGKSSIAALLEGNMTLLRGEIIINGRSITKISPKMMMRAGVSVFHQAPSIIPTLTPWENVVAGHMSIGITAQGKREEIEHDILELCEKWGLHPDLRAPVHRLSRIESTIVELARALAFEPKVIMFDEPSVRFTSDEMQVLYPVLAERKSSKCAILYAASTVDEVLRIADELSIMKSGKIVETQAARSLDRDDMVDLAYSFGESREELVSKNIRLLKYKKYNEEIVSNLPLGTVFFDGEANIYLSNRSAYDILVTDPSTQIPESNRDELFEENRLTLQALQSAFGAKRFAQLMSSMKEGDTEVWKQWPTSRGRYVDAMVYPFHDSLKQLVGTILVLQDVTEERSMRDYLARVEKTSSIAQMAAGIVHEVNNPLGIISNYVELLLMKTKDHYSKERLEVIKKEIQRINGSMLSLLSFSSVDSSTLTPCDMNLVIRESLALLEYEAERLGIALKADIPPEQTLVRMDPARIKQVLINLLMNALDAGVRGGDIRVSLKKQTDNTVLLQVQDDGKGIPKERMQSLFTPFFSDKSESGHAGLGLSICKHITEVHGGRIWCESEPGHTVFFIELPCDGPMRLS